ncbi:MAG: hypothetical protein JSS07_10685 [Proteobacteria bacterium]|nr:hypothetical protein [Pseudomonadota bacterium]
MKTLSNSSSTTHSPLNVFNELPEELKNLIFAELPFTHWKNVSYVSKEFYEHIYKRSQALLERYFSYTKIQQPLAFKIDPVRLLKQKFTFLELKYKDIPRSLVLGALETNTHNIEPISQSPHAASLLAIAPKLTQEDLKDQQDRDKIRANALDNAAALGDLEKVKTFALQCSHKEQSDALYTAVIHGERNIANYLLSIIVKANSAHLFLIDELLELAVIHGHTHLVKQYSADGHIHTSGIENAIKAATTDDKNLEIVTILLKARYVSNNRIIDFRNSAIANNAPKIAALLRKKIEERSSLNQEVLEPIPVISKIFKMGLCFSLMTALCLNVFPLSMILTMSIVHKALIVSAIFVGSWFTSKAITQILVGFWGESTLKFKMQDNKPLLKEPRKFTPHVKLALSFAIPMYMCAIAFYSLSLSAPLTLGVTLIAIFLTLLSTPFCLRLLPINSIRQDKTPYNQSKTWEIEQNEETCSLSNLIGLYAPYKTTINDLQENIHQELKKMLDKEFKHFSPQEEEMLKEFNLANHETFLSNQERYDYLLTQIKPLSRLFTKKIIKDNPLHFYRTAINDLGLRKFSSKETPEMQNTMTLLKLRK